MVSFSPSLIDNVPYVMASRIYGPSRVSFAFPSQLGEIRCKVETQLFDYHSDGSKIMKTCLR